MRNKPLISPDNHMGHFAWRYDPETQQIGITDFNGIETRGLPVCHHHTAQGDPYGIHGFRQREPGNREVISEVIAMLSSKYLHPGAATNLLFGLSLDIDARTRSGALITNYQLHMEIIRS